MAQSSPWFLGVSQSITHDSNLFRVDGQQALAVGLSRSDVIYGTSLLAGLDQPIGRQRVTASANVTGNRFQSNDHLNNTSYGLKLGLDWSTIDRISGSLQAQASQNLMSFSDGQGVNLGNRRNLVRNGQVAATVRVGVVTRYTLEAGAGVRQQRHSAPEYAAQNLDESHVSLGLRWRPSAALSAGVALRATRTQLPNFVALGGGAYLDEAAQRTDIDLTAQWTPTGSSRLQARLSPTHTRYDRNAANDFSGLTGSLAWTWQPGGRLQLQTLLSRDSGQSAQAVALGIQQLGTVDYSRTTTALQVRADYALTGKISLNASLRHAERDLTNTLTGIAAIAREGSDRTHTLSLGARWSPLRSVLIGCDLGYEQRSASGGLSQSYSGDTLGCFGQLTLQ